MSNFPSHWVTTKGTTVFEFVTSGSRGWAQHYASTGAKFIRIGNLDHGSITLDLRDVQHVNPPSGAEGERTRLRPNDVLISITAELGMVGVVPAGFGEAYINQHIALARPSPDIHAKFVAWYFASDADGKKALRDMGRGGTKVGLGLDDIRNADVPLAPLPEQQRIADKLDTVLARVDAVNDRLARVAPLLKRFRQSVLAAATSGRLTTDWRDDQRSEAAWQALTLGSLSADLRYGTAKKCTTDAPGTPVLRIPNIGDAGLVNTEGLKYAEFDANEVAKLSLDEGDLLIIRSNGSVDLVGRACVIDRRAKGMLFAGYLIRLRVVLGQALPRYVWISLSAPITRSAIESTSRSTSGVNNINSEELKALQVQLPPLEEQAEIIRRVDILFAFADRLEARLRAAQTAASRLTPALLAKAFRGELVPQDPADEPAAELLRRLTARSSTPAKRTRAKQAS